MTDHTRKTAILQLILRNSLLNEMKQEEKQRAMPGLGTQYLVLCLTYHSENVSFFQKRLRSSNTQDFLQMGTRSLCLWKTLF